MLEEIIRSNIDSLKYIYPEIVVVLTLLAVIITDLLLKRGRQAPVAIVSTIGLTIALILIGLLYSEESRPLFAGMMALDPFSLFFKAVFCLATIIITLFSITSPEVPEERSGEYYALLLGIVLGGFMMASATNLLMMYLALELVSIPSYVLACFLKNDRRSSEAGLKYSIYGGVSSGAMIYGMSLLYGATGSINIYQISQSISQSQHYDLTLVVSIILIMAGLGYKIASVPFHFWTPDVYEGAPTPVTAYFSIVPKAAGFAMLSRFLYSGVSTSEWMPQIDWPYLLAIISAATMTLGNLVAIWQDNLKRLLAYSSIAHAGYILMGVVMLSPDGLKAVMFYIGVYLFMNLGAFLVVIAVSQRLNTEDIKGYSGLGWRSPFVAVAMTIFLFSLTGLPPTGGFVGKFYLFAAVIKGKYYWLAIVGVLNSVVSLYYYARIVKVMFLEDALTDEKVVISTLHTVLLTLLVIPTVLLGVYFVPLVKLADKSLELLGY